MKDILSNIQRNELEDIFNGKQSLICISDNLTKTVNTISYFRKHGIKADFLDLRKNKDYADQKIKPVSWNLFSEMSIIRELHNENFEISQKLVDATVTGNINIKYDVTMKKQMLNLVLWDMVSMNLEAFMSIENIAANVKTIGFVLSELETMPKPYEICESLAFVKAVTRDQYLNYAYSLYKSLTVSFKDLSEYPGTYHCEELTTQSGLLVVLVDSKKKTRIGEFVISNMARITTGNSGYHKAHKVLIPVA